MIVVIEGVDCTGKTTLAEHLAKELGLVYLHAGPPEQHPLIEYEEAIYHNMEWDEDAGLVMDRWHVGEGVWPLVFDRPSVFNIGMQLHIEMFLEAEGGQFVHATAPADVIRKRMADRGEAVLKPEQVELAIELFETRFTGTHPKPFVYDFDQVTLDETMTALQAVDAVNWVNANDPGLPWIGCPTPHYLLVGEQPAKPRGEALTIPFMPFENTAAAALMASLVQLPSTIRFAIVNALTPDGTVQDLKRAWGALQQPSVIALGNVADEALRAQGVPHGTVPHPQWVRRFKVGDIGRVYAGRIVEAGDELKDTR
jgi:gluconate kinase